MTGTAPLPTFVVGGAMRSGTTSLYRWLDAHPDVFMAPVKELQFFAWDRVWARGLDWYRDHFAGWGGERAVGEASPNYLYSPEAPARMAAVIPDLRFVAVVRHPVDRAHSHWWFHRVAGWERRSFEEAMGLVGSCPHLPYERRGRYAEQLRRVHEHLDPASVHVVPTDDLVADPTGAFAGLCRFLGVDDAVVPGCVGEVFNARGDRAAHAARFDVGRWKRVPVRLRPLVAWSVDRRLRWEPMAAATRAALLDRFAEPNAELEAMLGRPLPSWSR